MTGMLTSAPVTTVFRDIAYAISPPWLRGPVGQKFMYCQAIQYDALADAFAYAIRFGLPTYAAPDSLPYIGQDRQIDRGPAEPTASYTARLIQWLDLWASAGSAPSVIQSVTSYFIGFTIVSGTSPVTVETVNDQVTTALGTLNVWDSGPSDPPVHTVSNPGNWNWDGLKVPGRSWVIIFNGPWTKGLKWQAGGRKWGSGLAWGGTTTGTSQDGKSIKSLVKKWKSAGCIVQDIIVAFDNTWFQPASAPGSPKLPDGTWGTWGKITTIGGVRTRVPARTNTAIYLGSVQ